MSVERLEAAREAVENVLREYADILGPNSEMDDEDGNPIPEGVYLPVHWVLASEWSELESGDSWTRISSDGSASRATKIGLGRLASRAWD